MNFDRFKEYVGHHYANIGFSFAGGGEKPPFLARSQRLDIELNRNPNPFSSGIYWTVIIKAHGIPPAKGEGQYQSEAFKEAALILAKLVLDS